MTRELRGTPELHLSRYLRTRRNAALTMAAALSAALLILSLFLSI